MPLQRGPNKREHGVKEEFARQAPRRTVPWLIDSGSRKPPRQGKKLRRSTREQPQKIVIFECVKFEQLRARMRRRQINDGRECYAQGQEQSRVQSRETRTRV